MIKKIIRMTVVLMLTCVLFSFCKPTTVKADMFEDYYNDMMQQMQALDNPILSMLGGASGNYSLSDAFMAQVKEISKGDSIFDLYANVGYPVVFFSQEEYNAMYAQAHMQLYEAKYGVPFPGYFDLPDFSMYGLPFNFNFGY